MNIKFEQEKIKLEYEMLWNNIQIEVAKTILGCFIGVIIILMIIFFIIVPIV